MTLDGKIMVLLVEDDPHVRTSVVISLQRLGFDIEQASNGVQALAVLNGIGDAPGVEQLAAYDADVILLDLLMPVMTGYDFLEQYLGPVPVVVMSGFGELAQLPRTPFAIVTKPMAMVDVADTLRAAAASYRTPTQKGEG